MSTDFLSLLRTRYPAEAYALFPEVQSATAYQGRQRCDALAMGLWPSRGLDVIGFEFKASRSDWLRELHSPDKAEEIFQFCDRWYLVADGAAIVRAGELPSTWGLLVVHGDLLSEEVSAPKLDAKPFERQFVAAVLRKAQQEIDRAKGNHAEKKRDAAVESFMRQACIIPGDWLTTDEAEITRACAAISKVRHRLDRRVRDLDRAEAAIRGRLRAKDLENNDNGSAR